MNLLKTRERCWWRYTLLGRPGPQGPTSELYWQSGGSNMRIVVADDDPTILIVLTALLQKFGHEVIGAANGLEALAAIADQRISMVISDWSMPGLDGVHLCRRLRSGEVGHYVYFILLTARDDRDSLIQGMDAGADDFLVKPVDEEELRVRLRAGERIVGLRTKLEVRNAELERTNAELKQAYARIRSDLEAAAQMQAAQLPRPARLDGSLVDWLFLPSHFVAGDMFGYFPLDARHLAFYQFDVAGHGTSAALLSFAVGKLLLQAAAEQFLVVRPVEGRSGFEIVPPPEVVAALNRRFLSDGEDVSYFTMSYGYLDQFSGRVELTLAGHPRPVLFRRATGATRVIGLNGLPVGLFPEADYESTSVKLEPGDRLFLYSDGIVECCDADCEAFSEDRFLKLLRSTGENDLRESIGAVEKVLRAWRGVEEFDDDISLLGIERLAWPDPEARVGGGP